MQRAAWLLILQKRSIAFSPLTVDEVNIERVKSARFLGLTVQDNMKWNEHIHNIVKKASKRLYMLRLLKRSNACIDTLITVYTTIIRPVLEYACQVWHYNIQQYICEDIQNNSKTCIENHSSITKVWRSTDHDQHHVAEGWPRSSLRRILTMKNSKIFYHKQLHLDTIKDQYVNIIVMFVELNVLRIRFCLKVF